jgi:Leucine-rich repeat (LRR) protein
VNARHIRWFAQWQDLVQLSHLPNLRSLEIVETDFSAEDASLEALTMLQRLDTLRFERVNSLTDSLLATLSQLSNLRSFELDRVGRATDLTLLRLASCPALERIVIDRCRRVTGFAFEFVRFPGLRELHLRQCDLSERALVALPNSCPQLEQLELSGTPWRGHHLGQLVALQHLVELRLERNKELLASELGALREMKTIRRLSLAASPKLHDGVLLMLGDLTQLESLSLARCRALSAQGLSQLRALKALQRLDLSHCAITTLRNMSELLDLPVLEELRLRQTTLMDEDLERLAQIGGTLRLLDLREASGFSAEGFERLTLARADVLVRRSLE